MECWNQERGVYGRENDGRAEKRMEGANGRRGQKEKEKQA